MRLSIGLVALAASAPALVYAAKAQKADLVLPADAKESADKVRDIFLNSYDAYKKYAWGHDDLTPLSKSFYDGRNGWGASIVDAMTTLHVMGEQKLFDEAADFATKIDFSNSKTDQDVSVFETTIRYIGGLLSSYELSGKTNQALVTKAQEVADKLTKAWTDDHAIPWGHIFFQNDTVIESTSNIAEAGTLVLEWGRLSEYTGDSKYIDLALKAFDQIISLDGVFPGFAAQGINPATGKFDGGYASWSGGADSYFEYLIKWARLTNTEDTKYADTWRTAVNSSIKYLLRRSTVGDYLYTASYDKTSDTYRHIGSHLACFHGGNWLFGGKLVNNQTIQDSALELIDGCWNTYSSTATGIGPEAFAFISTDGNYTGGSAITSEQLAYYKKHGHYITSPYYILRPEVLESNFIAWRVTGDEKYYRRAQDAVESFNKYLKLDEGYAGLYDVNDVNSEKIDDMESFWFAEVLKYLFLTFDDPNNINIDEWVFNTEAHPFKAPPPLDTYGSGKLVESENTEFTPSRNGDLPVVSAIPFVDNRRE